VEIDTETGHVRVVCVHAVVDCGTVMDPPGAHGQVVGAVAQAIGQVLHEAMVHDDHGTPLTSNLADYAVPSAAEVPFVDVHFRPTRASTNPLGAKGVGEIGMIAGPAALVGAVVDACGDPFAEPDVPCTPERVWSMVTRRGQR
jgi:carbon-monoxide dehydrogenase large subunit